jgi:hypothetical protein
MLSIPFRNVIILRNRIIILMKITINRSKSLSNNIRIIIIPRVNYYVNQTGRQ